MSDSVKKWHETITEDIHAVYETADERREKKINKLLNKAKESGRMTEIMQRVLEVQNQFKISREESEYLIFTDKVSNSAYTLEKEAINILMKNGDVIDLASASDHFNIQNLNKTVNRHFMCYPKVELSTL